MIVYEGIKLDFLKSVEEDTIAKEIEKKVFERLGRHTPENEYNSWVHSMDSMYKVMTDPYIPENAGIAIEYNIPQTSKRVDFMITGYNEENAPGMIIIELKKWSSMNRIDSTEALVETFIKKGMHKVVHPSYQAWSYARLIEDYNSSVQDNHVCLAPCAFLHNYCRQDNDPVDDKQYSFYTDEAPVFTHGQVKKLRDFIKSYIRKGDNREILYLVDQGTIRPSKSLQDSITSMINGNEEFVMIDEQRVVYEEILKISTLCQNDHKKRTVICKGGPGTGKSVIAVRLLADLTRQGQLVQFTSKNSAPRQVYAAKLRGTIRQSRIDIMFQGSGSYVDAENNTFHTLIVDEAHRLNDKSGMFHNKGENQIKEIIHAANCSVFFIDEEQRVTMNDIGSVQEICKWAKYEGSEVCEMELVSQFRCNGSDGYLAWIDNLLEIRDTANYDLDGIDYEVKVCKSPEEVRTLILEKNRPNNRSRILAGYCWNWPKGKRNDTNYHDIQIGDFGISWNLEGSQAYAIDENSVNEAGCIHTAQGLEFDYVGVIIGDDIRYENGHIVTDFWKRAATDQSMKGIKSLYKKNPAQANERADEIIKNTYRTLMTRGMKGCYIYCIDPGLEEHIRNSLNSIHPC